MKKILFFFFTTFLHYSCKKETTNEEAAINCGLYEIAEVLEPDSDTIRHQLKYDDQNRLSSVSIGTKNSNRSYTISYDEKTGKPVRLTGPYETIAAAYYTANFEYNQSGHLISAQSSNIRLDYEYENGIMKKALYSYRDYFDEPGKYKPNREYYPEYDSKGNMVKLTEKQLFSSGLTLVSNFEYTDVPHVCREMGVLIFAGYYTLGTNDIFNGFNGQIDFGPFMVKSVTQIPEITDPSNLKYTLSNTYKYDSKGRVVYSQWHDWIEPAMTSSLRKTRVYKYGCN